MKLSENLRKLRLEKRVSVQKLSKKLQKSTSTIYSWERGVFEPDFETLTILADIYGCTVDYLVGRENDNGVVEISKELSDDESCLLRRYCALNKEKKQLIMLLLKIMGEQ